ncbi:MAG: alpha/beta hydrolase [Clostridia bacterium]|nr:alpha/beta hydrolase [Clostridia bacterium]
MVFVYVIAGLAVIYLCVSFYMTKMLFFRSGVKSGPTKKLIKDLEVILEPYKEIRDEGMRWLSETDHEEVFITSDDGLKLKASVYENPDAKAVLIGFHGYRSSYVNDFAGAGSFYYESGFTLIMPDHRAGGKSEGKYITFGIKESDDAVRWCEYAKERYKNVPVAAAGISMGAATVMMAADKYPDNVKMILTDCGFDDPADEISYAGNRSFRGASLLLPCVMLMCRVFCGFRLRQKSSSRSLASSDLPLFIAHGKSDAIVPIEHAYKIKASRKAPTELFTVDGAGHGMSFLADPDGYKTRLGKFFDSYLFNENK